MATISGPCTDGTQLSISRATARTVCAGVVPCEPEYAIVRFVLALKYAVVRYGMV